jgi:hypothetical protein
VEPVKRLPFGDQCRFEVDPNGERVGGRGSQDPPIEPADQTVGPVEPAPASGSIVAAHDCGCPAAPLPAGFDLDLRMRHQVLHVVATQTVLGDEPNTSPSIPLPTGVTRRRPVRRPVVATRAKAVGAILNTTAVRMTGLTA